MCDIYKVIRDICSCHLRQVPVGRYLVLLAAV